MVCMIIILVLAYIYFEFGYRIVSMEEYYHHDSREPSSIKKGRNSVHAQPISPENQS